MLDSDIMRLRPVMIAVAATLLSRIPLTVHGGTLWESLCYTQIGGLTVATFVTLLMVPLIYAIAALDLKIVD
jgi:multidrug efflux pump